MKQLNFGCRRSDFLTITSKKNYFVQCRFYEEGREKPFTFRRSAKGFKTETERKKMLKFLEAEMRSLLDEKDYNPRTQSFMFIEGELNPYLSLFDALSKALAKKEYTDEYRYSVDLTIKKIEESAKKLNLDHLKIKDVELPHIKKLIEYSAPTNNSYNYKKKQLSSLFTDLVDAGCLKINPCTGIKSKRHIVEIKEIYSKSELAELSKWIKRNMRHFDNFAQIFFYSGCRVTEIIKLKKSDVNLEKREFTITLLKGGMYVREKRAMVQNSVIYWERQMKHAKDNDYLFGNDFKPSGKRHVLADYVYKLWKYKIPTDKTIYALKHTFLDMVESANFNAQIAAGHRKDSTTAIYTVGRQKRRLEAQKSILIS